MPTSRSRARRSTASGQSASTAVLDVVLQIDIVSLLPWAKGIARGVREDYGYVAGSQEEQELEGVAYLALVELSERFDEARLPPDGNLMDAFRGWADKEMRSRCRRAAVQIRNGGLFRTTNSANVRRIRVEGLPTAKCEDGSEEVVLQAREEPEEEE